MFIFFYQKGCSHWFCVGRFYGLRFFNYSLRHILVCCHCLLVVLAATTGLVVFV